MSTIRQALKTAREDVSPLCQFGRKQWVFYWSSRRGREQSNPADLYRARIARAARLADIAAERLAQEKGLEDPADAGSYAAELVWNGQAVETAIRYSIKTIC